MTTKIRITNKTGYQTRHLRAIAARAIKGYYSKSELWIEFHPSRYRHTGCAYLNSWACVVRIPPPGKTFETGHEESITIGGPQLPTLAALIAHEAAHCMGVTHKQMNSAYRELQFKGTWRERFAWADDYPLEVQPTPAKKARPTGLTLAETRHRHAVTKADEWTAKRKKAATIEKKWRGKAKYYERRMAAMRETRE